MNGMLVSDFLPSPQLWNTTASDSCKSSKGKCNTRVSLQKLLHFPQHLFTLGKHFIEILVDRYNRFPGAEDLIFLPVFSEGDVASLQNFEFTPLVCFKIELGHVSDAPPLEMVKLFATREQLRQGQHSLLRKGV